MCVCVCVCVCVCMCVYIIMCVHVCVHACLCAYVYHISSAPFLHPAYYPLTVDLSAVTCRLCFSRVREAAGLDRCHVQVVGAAPIAKNILEFFLDFDIPIYEIYGMSESSGPQTVSRDGGLGAPKCAHAHTHTHTCTTRMRAHTHTHACTTRMRAHTHMHTHTQYVTI